MRRACALLALVEYQYLSLKNTHLSPCNKTPTSLLIEYRCRSYAQNTSDPEGIGKSFATVLDYTDLALRFPNPNKGLQSPLTQIKGSKAPNPNKTLIH